MMKFPLVAIAAYVSQVILAANLIFYSALSDLASPIKTAITSSKQMFCFIIL